MKQDPVIAHIQSVSRRLMQQLGLFDTHTVAIKSVSQYHALLELTLYKVMNMVQLSNVLNLEQSTTSRLVVQLIAQGLCQVQRNTHDRRNKLISLTEKGSMLAEKIHAESQLQTQQALSLLNKKERAAIAHGLSLYSQVLHQSRLKEECKIRKLHKKDIPQLQEIYKLAQTEYGLNAHHETIFFLKTNLKNSAKNLAMPRSGYFVVEHKKEIIGGAGYSPLSDDYSDVCIIKCFYLSLHARGLGLCKLLMKKVFSHAKLDGYQQCYSEDYSATKDLSEFHKKTGFKKLETIPLHIRHNSTNDWYLKKL